MKKINIFFNVLLVLLIVVIFMMCLWKCSPETRNFVNRLKIEVEREENKKYEYEDEEEGNFGLTLKCAGNFLSETQENKVTKETLPSLEVYTPYDITNYKVIGQEGKLIKEGTYEKLSDTDINSFKIEGATEEVTEIRLIGYDKKMKKLADQYYTIVLN